MPLNNDQNQAKPEKLALRFFLLIAMPYILGAWIFPHTQYAQGNALSALSQNTSGPAEVVSYSFNDTQTRLRTSQVNSIFPLANYLDFPPLISHGGLQICFSDTGSSLTLPSGRNITPAFDWAIGLSDGRTLNLTSGSLACTSVDPAAQTTYSWSAQVPTGLSSQELNGSVTFNPQTSAYPREVLDYGMLQGLVMIPVFYLFIWYPLTGIWKKLRHGMLEQ